MTTTGPETALAPPPGPIGRPFVGRFLLPLVKGGTLHVGRPLGARVIAAMVQAWRPGVRRQFNSLEEMAEEDATNELARLRQSRIRALLGEAGPPPLDEQTVRLGAAVHNLLALGHPDLGEGLALGLTHRTLARRQEQIVEVTLPIADLGPPRTEAEAVLRHSLLARLPEITRTEHTVEYWAGRRRFVGRTPPAHLLALPRVRRVSTTSMRRLWFKEIGVPVCGRPLWIAIHRASPLGEALDPTRLDPPLAWERILPVLRFPTLCRVVAGNMLELGLEATGTALVTALMRFAARTTEGANPGAVAFAIRFLSHVCWLHHLYGREELGGGSELAAMLVAAADVEPSLVWPPDVPRDAEVFAAFRARLDGLAAEVHARAPDRYQQMLTVARLAATSGRAAIVVGS